MEYVAEPLDAPRDNIPVFTNLTVFPVSNSKPEASTVAIKLPAFLSSIVSVARTVSYTNSVEPVLFLMVSVVGVRRIGLSKVLLYTVCILFINTTVSVVAGASG